MASQMAPASANEVARWNREFQELGAEQVRSGLILGRWDKDKRSAARQWLERNDALTWQARRPPRSSSRGTFFLNLRSAKWWGYVGGALFLAMGLFRLWRRW